MWTRRLRSISEGAALAATLVLAGAPASADEAAVQRLVSSAPSKALYAGVAIDKLAIPGLHVRTRDDHAPERGGIMLAFADDQGDVRVVVRLAVAKDAAGARSFAQTIVRGVSGVLDPSAIDEIAFAETADRYVVAAH